VVAGHYKYWYQEQERQTDLDLNWDSFKYRNYDYAIGRFMSVDPLAEKYPYNSLYAFQENKLGLGRELEGLELVYRRGTSEEFKRKFSRTVRYMNKKGTAHQMAELNKAGRTEIVDNTGKGSYYNPKEHAIYWDPTMAVFTTNFVMVSPATVLAHEVDHALQHKKNPKQFNRDIHTPDPNYHTKEEKRVITTTEQEVARRHGEINENEVTRTDYNGIAYTVPNPTSTEDAQPRENELSPVIIDTRKKTNQNENNENNENEENRDN